MARVRDVERQIRKLEGFRVAFLHPDGRDVRGDKMQIPGYTRRYARMAFNSMSVTDWIESRFRPHYPGYDVKVLKANGQRAHGNYKLGTVRNTYLSP